MKIKPGQSVYQIYFDQNSATCPTCGQRSNTESGEWKVDQPLRIVSKRTTEREGRNSEAVVEYRLWPWHTTWVPSDQVFVSKAEAQAAADERNKES